MTDAAQELEALVDAFEIAATKYELWLRRDRRDEYMEREAGNRRTQARAALTAAIAALVADKDRLDFIEREGVTVTHFPSGSFCASVVSGTHGGLWGTPRLTIDGLMAYIAARKP